MQLAPDLIGWGQSAHLVRDYQIADLTTLAEFIQNLLRSSGGGVFLSQVL